MTSSSSAAALRASHGLLGQDHKPPLDILVAHPRIEPSAGLHEPLGFATVDTPTGIVLNVDERRQTSMPGIFAAGDLATPFLPSVTQATWQGAMAGIFAQQSMLT